MIRPVLRTVAAAALLLSPDLQAQCLRPTRIAQLDSSLYETSGLAHSRRDANRFWTLVDSDGDSAVFAFDTAGTLLQRVRVRGAANRDWEDIASGPCPGGAGSCLWLADTGDNQERHPDARIYIVPEPLPGDTVSEAARLVRLAFPGGPRDTEALFVTEQGEAYLVTKGRNEHPVELYSVAIDTSGAGTLLPLQTLVPRVNRFQGVTGASASPDGRWVAIRSYTDFVVYRRSGAGNLLRLEEVPGSRTPFLQPQGESIAFGADGIYFTSEVPPGESPPLERTRCTLEP
jgi:hypothetical protein